MNGGIMRLPLEMCDPINIFIDVDCTDDKDPVQRFFTVISTAVFHGNGGVTHFFRVAR